MSHYVLVTGGRDPEPQVEDDVRSVLGFCQSFYGGTLRVMHGAARGVDTVAAEFCEANGIVVKGFPADWGRGRQAGLERNQAMVDALVSWIAQGHSGQVLAFRGGRGTAHCAQAAEDAGLLVDRIPLHESWTSHLERAGGR